MNPSEALARHRIKIREAAGRFPVANPRVFGSVARGHDQSNSDLDIFGQTANPSAEAGDYQWTSPVGTNAELVPELEFDQTLGW